MNYLAWTISKHAESGLDLVDSGLLTAYKLDSFYYDKVNQELCISESIGLLEPVDFIEFNMVIE